MLGHRYTSIPNSVSRGAYPGAIIKKDKPKRKVSGSIYDHNVTRDDDNSGENPSVVLVDSSVRNTKSYPDPNHYSTELSDPQYQITSLSLAYAYIPLSGYSIQSHNNMFYFRDTQDQIAADTYFTIVLPIGNYPIIDDNNPSILLNLQEKMNELSSSTYSVTVNKYTNKVTFTQGPHGSGIFQLLFDGGDVEEGPQTKELVKNRDGSEEYVTFGKKRKSYLKNSVGPVIGFGMADLKGATSYTSQGIYNLSPDLYVLMRIKCDGRNLNRISSNNNVANGNFCPVYLNKSDGNFQYSSEINLETYSYLFNPPLPKLSKITIEFYHPNGGRYEFNGKDHVLSFEIDSLSRKGKYRGAAGVV